MHYSLTSLLDLLCSPTYTHAQAVFLASDYFKSFSYCREGKPERGKKYPTFAFAFR